MSTQGTIHSYYLIIDKLRKAPYPTKRELFDYLSEEGLLNSIRSLERRIEEIRTEFHLDIPYNPRTNSYSLSDEDQKSLNDLLRFLELNTITRIFGDSIKISREAIRHFSFDTDGSFQGIAILKPLLNAIQTRHRINFSYQRFQENSASEHKGFCPLILREYLGRWYVGGNFHEKERLFTFGLDRINSLSVLDETFIPIMDNPASMFDPVIGVALMEPVRVELAFSHQQAKYIKTLPLHHSQEIVAEDEDEVIFRYYVATNYELVQRILMYGNEVRVLMPQNLVDDVKYILKVALNNYIPK